LVLLASLAAGAARADAGSNDVPQVALDIDPCVAVSQAEVQRRLALEIGERVISLGEASPTSSHAAATCDESGRITLRIDDPLTRKSIWRSIDLTSQEPSVRARLLAVAIAELLYASFAELLLEKRTEPDKPKPAQPPMPVAVVQTWSGRVEDKLKQPLPPLGVELGAVGSILFSRKSPSLLAGGGLRLIGDTSYHLGWDVDVQYLGATTENPLGDVRSDLFGARFAVHGQVRVPRVYIRGGGGLRLGLIRNAGTPSATSDTGFGVQWGPWLTPTLVGSISVAIGRLRLDLSLEGGYVLVPVRARAAGQIVAEHEGPQLLVSLGVGSFLR
jgi:hypothetical protein